MERKTQHHLDDWEKKKLRPDGALQKLEDLEDKYIDFKKAWADILKKKKEHEVQCSYISQRSSIIGQKL